MTAIEQALTPVVDALISAARHTAHAAVCAADRAAATSVDGARARAEEMLADARRQGIADARAVVAAQRARGRRQARALVLSADREAYERLVAAAHGAVVELVPQPEYVQWLGALRGIAKRTLGQRATVREDSCGGLLAQEGTRRMDLRLGFFADRALAKVAGQS